MKSFLQDIEQATLQNDAFRRVLHTAQHCQLVVMSLEPGSDIGMEVHDVDQFFRIEAGTGEVLLEGVTSPLQDGVALVVPAGMRHNIVNTGSERLKLYTLYAPPHHRDGVVHRTKAEADADHEHFDGRTTA